MEFGQVGFFTAIEKVKVEEILRTVLMGSEVKVAQATCKELSNSVAGINKDLCRQTN